MPKPAITRINGGLQVAANTTNKNNGFYAPQLTAAQIAAIPAATLVNGAIVYDTDANLLKTFVNGALVDVSTGAGAGDVVGPAGAIDDNIATFDGATGKLIKDSGVAIGQVPGPLPFRQFSPSLLAQNAFVNEIRNLGHVSFIDGLGIIFVDGLTPVEFLLNDLGGGDSQVCSLFTGGLPSSSTTPSALVEIQSATGALLLSRLSQAQINIFPFPTAGMILFNTDSSAFCAHNGTDWLNVALFNDNNTLTVATPIAPTDATNKSYTDQSRAVAGEIFLSNILYESVGRSIGQATWSRSLKRVIGSGILGAGAALSTDGLTWSNIATFPLASSCVEWSPTLGLFSAIEVNGTLVYTSTNGITWTAGTPMSPPFYFSGAGVNLRWIESFGRFYVGGSDIANRIYSSVDGITYTPSASTRRALDFQYGAGTLVAVGEDGPQYSTDGITWVNSTSTIPMGSVAYSTTYGYFVAMPLSPADQTLSHISYDGITWTSHVAFSSPTQISSFIWIPSFSMFVGAGPLATKVQLSNDGISFKTVNITTSMPSLIYELRYIEEWGELLLLGVNNTWMRTAKRFVY